MYGTARPRLFEKIQGRSPVRPDQRRTSIHHYQVFQKYIVWMARVELNPIGGKNLVSYGHDLSKEREQ